MANRSPFTNEFKMSHATLAGGAFAGGARKVIEKLVKLSDENGPHDGYASGLADLRKLLVKSESNGILAATDAGNDKKPTAIDEINPEVRTQAAALKLMRHLELMRKRGSHKLWIVSLPDSFNDWPSVVLKDQPIAQLRALLEDTSQRFSPDDKKHLSNATQEALKWCHKTLILLANAAMTKEKKAAPGLELVKRWFLDETASDRDAVVAMAVLELGFKKINAVLSSGHLLLTDHPEVRGATSSENLGYRKSEAFVKGLREAMDVVYIEEAFFKNNNTLKGLTNWTRILVHELSHREVRTVDKFYSWEGIGPTADTFPTADALVNADSWAFFCADAAGQLTETERNKALQ
ncbi:M35 family metallo-endopeptidase [Nevskia sp.]|uniref:M35 family metallo-endopeptidase n=1 Tax=Nevskia sp. TaxID=1929292 RepID=UPI0025FDE429|nr:M35 family metallo-endopeptidase [Nevskia sp.]